MKIAQTIRSLLFGCPSDGENADARKAWREPIHDNRNIAARSIGVATVAQRSSTRAEQAANDAIEEMQKTRREHSP